jgi:hypothetical protein
MDPHLMRRLRQHLQDPSLPAVAGSVVGVLLGVGGILAAWAGASLELFAPLQTPWVLSAGLGGLMLVGLSTALLCLHLRRRAVVRELLLLEEAELVALRLLERRLAG